MWRRVRTWTRRRCSSSTAGQCTPVSINGPPDLVEKRHPSLGLWICLDKLDSRDLNSPAPQWIILLEIANYGPITSFDTVQLPSTASYAPHAIRANFPSTAAEVSLENLLWDFPVPDMVDFGAGARRGGARDGHAVSLNDRNTRAIQVTARHRADHRSHRAAPARHRPDHRALSHPPPTLRGVFWRGCCFPESSAKRF